VYIFCQFWTVVFACVRVRAGVHKFKCLFVGACVRTSVRACVLAVVRLRVCTCVRALCVCVCVCVCACVLASPPPPSVSLFRPSLALLPLFSLSLLFLFLGSLSVSGFFSTVGLTTYFVVRVRACMRISMSV
jgi:hypothetical protein